ncbi:hypothetical protein ACR77J_07450 [Tissierella praeacuta]|uniref:hypothetical protein n=1 Tax=Tissierella praeacuta TaxID=43131 RepID=UPI003DA3601B
MWKRTELEKLNEFLKVVGIASIVTITWQLLEIVILGKIAPNKVDSIIAVILTLSLYANLNTINK